MLEEEGVRVENVRGGRLLEERGFRQRRR